MPRRDGASAGAGTAAESGESTLLAREGSARRKARSAVGTVVELESAGRPATITPRPVLRDLRPGYMVSGSGLLSEKVDEGLTEEDRAGRRSFG